MTEPVEPKALPYSEDSELPHEQLLANLEADYWQGRVNAYAIKWAIERIRSLAAEVDTERLARQSAERERDEQFAKVGELFAEREGLAAQVQTLREAIQNAAERLYEFGTHATCVDCQSRLGSAERMLRTALAATSGEPPPAEWSSDGN